MIGTVQRNFLHRLGDAWQAWKASPLPAQLYAPQQSNISTGYLTFPGWDVVERQQANRDEANAKTAINSPWVYRNIAAIAKEFSVANLDMKERQAEGEDEDIENHPLELLWENPNPFMGRAWLMQWWTWQLLLYGEAYLYVVAGPDGSPSELWPLPSAWMTPHGHPKRFIDYFIFKRPGSQEEGVKIDTRPVVYSRLPNPFDIRRGLSPLVAALVDIQGDIAMAKWNANFFSKENATPTGVVSVPKDTLDTDISRIRQEIQDFFGGSTRRVAVARAGDLAWTPFDRSQKDMDFLNARIFTQKLVDTIFGIPEGFWSKDATRANSEGAKATMIENAVWPHLVMLAEDLNAQLVPLWYGDGLRAEFADIRPRNRALELQEFTAYQAVLTVDELRAKIDMDEIGDLRGLMLTAEITKGAPITATEASNQTEEALAEQEAAAMEEAGPEEGALPEEEVAPVEGGGAMPLKAREDAIAADLLRWERKAVKSLKRFHTADVRFDSNHIPLLGQQHIREELKTVTTVEEVKAVFAPRLHVREMLNRPDEEVKADVDDLIDSEWPEALAWAGRVTGE